MKIRCSKCFKKYDDSDIECPRCGKINDRDYSKRRPDDNIEKAKLKFSFNRLKRYECGFCGTKALFEGPDCSYCGSSNTTALSDNEHADREEFDTLINDLFISDGLVNLGDLESQVAKPYHVIHQWKIPYYTKFGSLWDRLAVLFLGGVALFIAILYLGSGSGTTILILLVLLGLPGFLLLMYLSNNFYSDEIRFSGDLAENSMDISWYNRAEGARDKTIRYQVLLSNLSSIEIDLGEKINGLRFIAKPNTQIQSRDFYIDTRNFNNEASFKRMIVLLVLKMDAKLYIKRKDVVTHDKGILETYVRQDDFIREATEAEKIEHEDWLSLFEDNYECQIGYTENRNLMMIFKVNSNDNTQETIKEDPYIKYGIVSTNVFKWTKELS